LSASAQHIYSEVWLRTELPGYQRASLIDPLTGVANRRGFLQAGERLMVRIRFARSFCSISITSRASMTNLNTISAMR
jgi:GGDEF domain-containing protein